MWKPWHLYILRNIPIQCAMVSFGAILKIGSIYLALIKVNPKSQTIYRDRNRVCVFARPWRGMVGRRTCEPVFEGKHYYFLKQLKRKVHMPRKPDSQYLMSLPLSFFFLIWTKKQKQNHNNTYTNAHAHLCFVLQAYNGQLHLKVLTDWSKKCICTYTFCLSYLKATLLRKSHAISLREQKERKTLILNPDYIPLCYFKKENFMKESTCECISLKQSDSISMEGSYKNVLKNLKIL